MSLFSLRNGIRRTTSKLDQLKPSVQALKTCIEKRLERSSDFVFFNENKYEYNGGKNATETVSEKAKQRKQFMPGVTDISFEKFQQDANQRKHRVSVYFASSKDGVRAYRDMARKTANLKGVEYKFTPQFGHSRISFQWEDFWEQVNRNEFPVLLFSNDVEPLQLGNGKEE
mmetsp:Transcript_17144/g.21120  ORF Transcript_17144/g.21120 Transcript_17144/m.21120 type:complete len:171 (+) Transcript_17144:196-708(+)